MMGEDVHSSNITVNPQMFINRRMTNKWLYSDPGTPCSNEKNKLDLYRIYLLNRYLLNTYYVPYTVFGTGPGAINKTDEAVSQEFIF